MPAAVVAPAAISAGGSLLGGILGNRSAGQAAKQQAYSQAQALAFERERLRAEDRRYQQRLQAHQAALDAWKREPRDAGAAVRVGGEYQAPQRGPTETPTMPTEPDITPEQIVAGTPTFSPTLAGRMKDKIRIAYGASLPGAQQGIDWSQYGL